MVLIDAVGIPWKAPAFYQRLASACDWKSFHPCEWCTLTRREVDGNAVYMQSMSSGVLTMAQYQRARRSDE